MSNSGDTYRLVVAMFRNEFIDKQKRDVSIAYHTFYGDPTKIRLSSTVPKKRTSLDFTNLMREAGKDDPTVDGEADYNKPESHYAFIAHTLLWALQEPQVPTNRAWHMLFFLRISPSFRRMVCSATWPSIAVPYFEGNQSTGSAGGERIKPFDLRFDEYLCGEQSSDLKTVYTPARLTPQCIADEWILYNSIATRMDCPHGGVP